MTTRRKSLKLLLIAVILAAASLIWWVAHTPPAHADEPPCPLPAECGGSGNLGTCCVRGYVYYNDAPVAGASVTVQSISGSTTITTGNGVEGCGYPYYAVSLDSPPLSVVPGDVITITASYSDMVSARTWMVQSDGQHVDIGMVAGYQAPGLLSALTTDALDLTAMKASGGWAMMQEDMHQSEYHVTSQDRAYLEDSTIHRSALYPTQAVITADADGARSVYAADVDGDGDMDVLSASLNDDKIAWYENDGSSSPAFTSHIITTDADGARSVYAADVDGDGDMDVLSASRWDDKIAWYENNGGLPPAFTSHVITTTADDAVSVHAADVDGDGDMDVLSASREDDKIVWYENDGGSPPSFASHIITDSVLGPWSVYAEDVDDDGDVDVLSASGDDSSHDNDRIIWYENDGGSPPAFTLHIITTSAQWPSGVYAADVDGDGNMDVLSSSWTDDKIAWYRNDGVSPPSFTPYTITTNADEAWSVYAKDLDGDNDVDVLSASARDDTIAWYENDGGSPPAFTEHVITTNADVAFSVYAANVDGEGDMDVLSASAGDDKIAWYENRGGQFALATTDTAPFTIITGQRDDVLQIVATHRGRAGDTDAELVTLELLFEESVGDPLTTVEANNLIKNLYIYRDDGSGVFEPDADTLVTTVGTLSLVTGAQTVPFADGDPNVQVAFGSPITLFVVVELTGNAVNQTPNRFRVTHMTECGGSDGLTTCSTAEDRDHDLPLVLEFAPNVASGICTAPTTIYSHEIVIPFGTGSDRTFAVDFGDADNDGDLDLAVGNHGPNQVCWYNGNGTFDCQDAFGGSPTFDVEWGDMDGDGYLDLVVANSLGHANWVCLNNGDLTFTCDAFSRCAGPGPNEVCFVALGDVDNDGDVDIALGTRYPGSILAPDVIYYNNGDATFPITDTACQGHPTIELDFGDVNKDGWLDLAVVGHYSEYVCINDGTGHFTETRWLAYRLDKNTQSVALGDADGDDDLDIAVGRESYSNEVYLNDGSGYFPEKLSFGPVWERTWDVAWGDVDGDGDLDIATGNSYQPIVIYFNEPVTATNGITFVKSGYLSTGSARINSVAFGDVNGDGEPDLAAGSDREQNVVYVNFKLPPDGGASSSPSF